MKYIRKYNEAFGAKPILTESAIQKLEAIGNADLSKSLKYLSNAVDDNNIVLLKKEIYNILVILEGLDVSDDIWDQYEILSDDVNEIIEYLEEREFLTNLPPEEGGQKTRFKTEDLIKKYESELAKYENEYVNYDLEGLSDSECIEYGSLQGKIELLKGIIVDLKSIL